MFVKLFLVLMIFSAFAEEECEIPGTPFQEIQNILRAARDNCTEIAPGTFRLQNTESGRAQHILERDTNGNYRATFQIEFKPQGGVTTSPEFMQNKMNECLLKVAPYLKGPDGNTITMRIINPTEAKNLTRQQKPKKFKIAIGAVGSRSNTRMFSADDDCATFTHEMLHHMGLQDEYPERSEELKDRWNCRPLTREDSVMYNHVSGLNAALPSTIECRCSNTACETLKVNPNSQVIRMISHERGWPLTQEFQRQFCTYNYAFLPENTPIQEQLRVESDSADTLLARFHSWQPNINQGRYVPTEMVLNCSCATDECRRQKAALLAKTGTQAPTLRYCPTGMTESNRIQDRGSYRPGFHNGMFRFSTTPGRSTILYPNQFKRAVAGTCQENIAGYGMCSEFAYTGSKKQCSTPEQCRNPDYYLGQNPQ